MKRPSGQTDAVTYEDEGRSRRFWIAVGVVLFVVLALLGTATVGAFLAPLDQEPPDSPQVAWQYGYLDATQTLTATHEGGDAVRADRISVTVDGEPTDDWSASNESIETGDRIVVGAARPGATVRFVWSDGDEPTVIGAFTVPD